MLFLMVVSFILGALLGNEAKNGLVHLFNGIKSFIKAKLSPSTASTATTATAVASDQKTPPTPPSVWYRQYIWEYSMLLKKEDIEQISINVSNITRHAVIEQVQTIELEHIMDEFNEKLKLIPHIENSTGYYGFPNKFKDNSDFSVRVYMNTHMHACRIAIEKLNDFNCTKAIKAAVIELSDELMKDLHKQLKDKTILILRQGFTLKKFNDPYTYDTVITVSLRYKVVPDIKYIKTEDQLNKELKKLIVSTKFLKGASEPIKV